MSIILWVTFFSLGYFVARSRWRDKLTDSTTRAFLQGVAWSGHTYKNLYYFLKTVEAQPELIAGRKVDRLEMDILSSKIKKIQYFYQSSTEYVAKNKDKLEEKLRRFVKDEEDVAWQLADSVMHKEYGPTEESLGKSLDELGKITTRLVKNRFPGNAEKQKIAELILNDIAEKITKGILARDSAVSEIEKHFKALE